MYRRALALVAVVAAAAAGDAPAGPYDNPICGTAAKLATAIANPVPPQVMASYNTVPDLESEAQPLAGAPPRKHGKATLAVVAALAFGAGALAPSAASRVSQMKMFAMACQEGDPDCVDTTQSVDGTGGDNAAVVQNDETPKNGQGVGGVYIPARK